MKGFWYAIKKNGCETPFLNPWKRDKKGKIPLLLLLSKNRGKGNVVDVFFLWVLEVVMESSIMLIFSLKGLKESLKL